MRTLSLAFLLVARCALAQLDDVAFVGSLTSVQVAGSSISPTNIGTPYAWYRADTYYTNAGYPTVLDEFGTLNITNQYGVDAGSPQKSTIDGQKYLKFGDVSGLTTLYNSATTIAQPMEIVLMCRFRAFAANDVLFNGPSSFKLYEGVAGANGGLTFTSDSSSFMDGPNTLVTNIWMVINVVINGASSSILTNNTTYVSSPSPGTTGISSTRLGGANDYTAESRIDVTQFVLYSAVLSSGDRASLYNYYKTNYPSASLP